MVEEIINQSQHTYTISTKKSLESQSKFAICSDVLFYLMHIPNSVVFVWSTTYIMAIASGWAGRVLARPLLCRLNVHVCTLNTRVYESSHQRLSNIVQISLTKRQHCIRIFSLFGVLDGHSLLRQSPCCLRHMCTAKFICRI